MNDITTISSGSSTELSITERSIATLWNEVLRTIAPASPTDDFFAAGGDSIAMVTLEFRIKEQMGVELAPGTIIAAPTLRALSSIVDSLLNSHTQPTAPLHVDGQRGDR